MIWPIYVGLLVLSFVSLFISPFVNKVYGLSLSAFSLLLFSFLAFESTRIGVVICY